MTLFGTLLRFVRSYRRLRRSVRTLSREVVELRSEALRLSSAYDYLDRQDKQWHQLLERLEGENRGLTREVRRFGRRMEPFSRVNGTIGWARKYAACQTP